MKILITACGIAILFVSGVLRPAASHPGAAASTLPHVGRLTRPPVGVEVVAGQDEADSARAAALIEQVIKNRGGAKYLSIRTLQARGQYTRYVKGNSTLPDPFVDYIVYPGRERTEFGKGDNKFVQTNSGATGWTYSGQTRTIKDQTDEQVKHFQQAQRFDLDNVLRGGWKAEGVKLVYVGRREVYTNTFSEAVRLEFQDNASLTLHIDPRSKLPLMTEFKIIDNANGPSSEQVRYYTWLDYDGVLFPKVQDSYSNGKQTARVFNDSVVFNADIPEKLFAKPANIKEVK